MLGSPLHPWGVFSRRGEARSPGRRETKGRRVGILPACLSLGEGVWPMLVTWVIRGAGVTCHVGRPRRLEPVPLLHPESVAATTSSGSVFGKSGTIDGAS